MNDEELMNKINELFVGIEAPDMCNYTSDIMSLVASRDQQIALEAQPGSELTPEDLALMFHNNYERLSVKHGYETRQDTRTFNPDGINGKLMIATAKVILKNIKTMKVKSICGCPMCEFHVSAFALKQSQNKKEKQ